MDGFNRIFPGLNLISIGKGISTSQMPLLMQVNMFLPLIKKIFALRKRIYIAIAL
jgi:hypothetical protein